MNQFELIIQAGQVKFYIDIIEKMNTHDLIIDQISKEKIKVTYHIVTSLEKEEVQAYVKNKLDELKGLYYLLQLKQIK